MSETVKISSDRGTTTIRIDRAAKKNALDMATYRGLAAGLAAARADDGCRAIVLTGGPEVFTAGNDLADFMAVRESGGEMSAGDFLRGIAECEKPIVAAVAGWAVGIGTTMLLHCDFVYAAPSARFKTPFVDLGLCPEAGSSVLLPAAIGPRHAAEMLYLGVEVDAARAREWGLISDIDADPLARAATVAAELAAKPPGALRKTKALMRRAGKALLAETMAAELDAFVTQLRSDEARQAVMAMLARRASGPR
jgi:enoyl-CoA hydratase/carnithine racemase